MRSFLSDTVDERGAYDRVIGTMVVIVECKERTKLPRNLAWQTMFVGRIWCISLPVALFPGSRQSFLSAFLPFNLRKGCHESS